MENSTLSQPLLEACTPDLYNGNVFRITGLPVYATEKEIKRAAEKQKMLDELGVKDETTTTPFALANQPSADAIKTAMNRLKMPEARVIDELFWFWPLDESHQDPAYMAFLKGKTDEAYTQWNNDVSAVNGGIATHNLAVMFHLTAMDWSNYQLVEDVSPERTEKILNYWKEAHERLQLLRQNDEFWTAFKNRVAALNEPMLTSGFVRRIRETFQIGLASIHADFALRFNSKGKRKIALEHVSWLKTCCPKIEQRELVYTKALLTHKNRVKQSVATMPESIKADPSSGAKIVTQALATLKSENEIFSLFYSDERSQVGDLFDPVLMTCINGLVSFVRKTENNSEFVRILKELQPLAISDEVKERITINIEGGNSGLNKERLSSAYKILDKIDKDEGHIAARLKEFKQEFMPMFCDFVEREGSNAESIKDLSDDAARSLRSISVDAYNKDKNYTLASDAIKLATLLARDQKLKELIAADIKTVEEAVNESTCHFCGKNPSLEAHAMSVDMHEITSRNLFGRAQQYRHFAVKVPRCLQCSKAKTKESWIAFIIGFVAFGIATAIIPGAIIIWAIGGLVIWGVLNQILDFASPRKPKSAYSRIQELQRTGWKFGSKPS